MSRVFSVVGRVSSCTSHVSAMPCSCNCSRTQRPVASAPITPSNRTSHPSARRFAATLAAPGLGDSWFCKQGGYSRSNCLYICAIDPQTSDAMQNGVPCATTCPPNDRFASRTSLYKDYAKAFNIRSYLSIGHHEDIAGSIIRCELASWHLPSKYY